MIGGRFRCDAACAFVAAAAILALAGMSITCPAAHAGTPSADPISVPAAQLTNPDDTPLHEDKAQTLDPDDDGDELQTHWQNPVIIVEGQRQIFYMVVLLGAAACLSAAKNTLRRKAARNDRRN